MHSRRKIFSFVGSAVAATALSRRAFAIDYPLRFVRIVVPFPPGGPNDVLARTIGRRLSELWRQEVIVENKPGANTQIGAELVAKSIPDGYTLMVTSDTTSVINPLLYKKLRYDPARDFVPVSGIVSNYPGLFAAKSLPVTSVTELIAFAKDKPGALNFGSFGLGSSGHLFMEMFQKMAGIKLAVIHYSGSGPALTDLMAGHIQLMFTNVSTAVPLVMDGKIKLLGVGSPKRFPQLPDVPTIAESGLPAFNARTWFAIYAPAGVPRDIIEKINGDVQHILADTSFKAAFLDPSMFEPMRGSSGEFAAVAKADMQKWSDIIRDAGVALD